MILFALISLGGCGGSSTTSGTGSDDLSLTMHRIWLDQEAAKEIVNRLTSEDMIRLLFVNMDEIERHDNGFLTMKHRNIAESVLGGRWRTNGSLL